MIDSTEIPALLRKHGRKQAELARYLRLDPSSLVKLIKGARQIKAREAVLIEQFFAGAEGEPEPARRLDGAPLFGRQPVGPLENSAAGDDISRGRVDISRGKMIGNVDPYPPRQGELLGVRIYTDAMAPRLFEGEVVVAQVDLPPVAGRDVLIEFTDRTALVRTFVSAEAGAPVLCRQWTPAREVAFERGQIRALHAVIWRG